MAKRKNNINNGAITEGQSVPSTEKEDSNLKTADIANYDRQIQMQTDREDNAPPAVVFFEMEGDSRGNCVAHFVSDIAKYSVSLFRLMGRHGKPNLVFFNKVKAVRHDGVTAKVSLFAITKGEGFMSDVEKSKLFRKEGGDESPVEAIGRLIMTKHAHITRAFGESIEREQGEEAEVRDFKRTYDPSVISSVVVSNKRITTYHLDAMPKRHEAEKFVASHSARATFTLAPFTPVTLTVVVDLNVG